MGEFRSILRDGYFKMKEDDYNTVLKDKYAVIRIDGRGFSKFTKNLNKPFDNNFMDLMEDTAYIVAKSISNSILYYTQSDEISILIVRDSNNDMVWGGRIQKLVSDTVATATIVFNELLREKYIFRGFKLPNDKLNIFMENSFNVNQLINYGRFDARIIGLSSEYEVGEYFVSRQLDCMVNSVGMLANSLYTSKELFKKNVTERKDMCSLKGIDWENFPNNVKYGRIGYLDKYNLYKFSGKYKSKMVKIKDTFLFHKGYEGRDLIDYLLSENKTKLSDSVRWNYTLDKYGKVNYLFLKDMVTNKIGKVLYLEDMVIYDKSIMGNDFKSLIINSKKDNHILEELTKKVSKDNIYRLMKEWEV